MDLVLLALIPPEPLRTELREQMEKYSAQLESTKALKLPPHITLFPPFMTKHLDDFIEDLQFVTADLHPFIVTLEKLHTFKSGALVYDANSEYIQKVHDVVADAAARHMEHRFKHPFNPQLSKRQRELIAMYGDPKVKEFYKPHLTLAKQDINKEKLAQLRAHMPEEHPLTYEVTSLQVMKHDGKQWYVVTEIGLF